MHEDSFLYMIDSMVKTCKWFVLQTFALFTDDELATSVHYELCNFKTVATRYPQTAKGQLVRGECDKLIDYHIETKRERRTNYYYGW